MIAVLKHVEVVGSEVSAAEVTIALVLRGGFAEIDGMRQTSCDVRVRGAACMLSFDISHRAAWVAPFMRSLTWFGPSGPSLHLSLAGGMDVPPPAKSIPILEALAQVWATEEAQLREVVDVLAQAIDDHPNDVADPRFAYAVASLRRAAGRRRRGLLPDSAPVVAEHASLAVRLELFVTELIRYDNSWEHIQIVAAEPRRPGKSRWTLKLFRSTGGVGLEFRERDNPLLFAKWAAFSSDEYGGYLRLMVLSDGLAVKDGDWAAMETEMREQIGEIVDQLSEGIADARFVIETISREEVGYWTLNAELVRNGFEKAKR